MEFTHVTTEDVTIDVLVGPIFTERRTIVAGALVGDSGLYTMGQSFNHLCAIYVLEDGARVPLYAHQVRPINGGQ